MKKSTFEHYVNNIKYHIAWADGPNEKDFYEDLLCRFYKNVNMYKDSIEFTYSYIGGEIKFLIEILK